jgi:aspartate aminotransferase
MYEHIMFEGYSFATLLNACPDLYERTVVMNGVSKAYSMTGWRIGYCGGPAKLIKAMKKVQSQSTSNPTSISQYAAQAALEGDQNCVREMCKAFEQRHKYVHAALNEIGGFECLPSAGTFYSFPNVEKALSSLDGIDDDVQFAEHLLDKVGVALVPGSAFGAPGHIRISFATSMENLEQAISRIKSAVNP